jgi:branched-chain amino acid transport system permease protein
MIRAGVDDMEMARGVGIPVSLLFTIVFLVGAALAGTAGTLGAPILNAYPGLDADMLPLALIVVILGGIGSLLGAFVGSFIVGFLYNFGIALFPDLAYFILFLPMVLILVFMPQGLFGRV